MTGDNGFSDNGLTTNGGLPNISGNVTFGNAWAVFPPGTATDCFTTIDNRTFGTSSGGATMTGDAALYFDASRSNLIYGATTDRVVPRALYMTHVIKY